MRINRVTFTGADNRTDKRWMFDLSEEYNFIEWGILVSTSRSGVSEFPSEDWIEEVEEMAEKRSVTNLSLHLCGGHVRNLLSNKGFFPARVFLSKSFTRVQVNFAGMDLKEDSDNLLDYLKKISSFGGLEGKEVILPVYDEDTSKFLSKAIAEAPNISLVPLYDKSFGTGVAPDRWPSPTFKKEGDFVYHGYAGGIGPGNIIEVMNSLSGFNCELGWLDMQSKVRTEGEFDLCKVHSCCKSINEYNELFNS